RSRSTAWPGWCSLSASAERGSAEEARSLRLGGLRVPGQLDVLAQLGQDLIAKALLQLVRDLSHALLGHPEALAERRQGQGIVVSGQMLSPDRALALVGQAPLELGHHPAHGARQLVARGQIFGRLLAVRQL